MMNKAMLDFLGCPICGGTSLQLTDAREEEGAIIQGTLNCAANHHFSIRSGVPVLIDQSLISGDDWSVWQQHLDGFQRRRERRQQEAFQITHRLGRSDFQQQAFSIFTGIQVGRLLDVGCGPGKFRYCFDLGKVEYVGLDPIILGDNSDFPLVAGIAEHLPFQNACFNNVTVLAALDHFKDKEAFFREVHRVLVPGGRFHLLQSIHEPKGVKGRLKYLAHELKDWIEARLGGANPEGVPEHMAEFGMDGLRSLLSQFFTPLREETYEPRLLAPTRLFITMQAI
jgi:SAM-dependent methyltransferase